jgi:hypothetical protein
MLNRIFVVIFLLIALVSCGKGKKDDVQVNIIIEPRMFPTPDFNDLFSSFDYLPKPNLDSAIPEEYKAVVSDVYIAAFHLGELTADAILAIKARNKTKLLTITQIMIVYCKIVGLNDEILKMADDLVGLVQEDKWEDLREALDKNKRQIELALYDTGQYDVMTLLQAGGWNEGIRTVTFLLYQNFVDKSTDILHQRGVIGNLYKNLNLMNDTELIEKNWFINIQSGVEVIFNIIKQDQQSLYSKEEVKELLDVSTSIKTTVANVL